MFHKGAQAYLPLYEAKMVSTSSTIGGGDL